MRAETGTAFASASGHDVEVDVAVVAFASFVVEFAVVGDVLGDVTREVRLDYVGYCSGGDAGRRKKIPLTYVVVAVSAGDCHSALPGLVAS